LVILFLDLYYSEENVEMRKLDEEEDVLVLGHLYGRELKEI